MYEKEEETLHRLKKHLEKTSLPLDKADGAILRGMEQAKKERRRVKAVRKRNTWLFVAAALLVLTLSTSIRVSPAFASAVSAIPGFDKIVDLIQFDKGLSAVFENDYYQEIGAAQEKDGMALTVDGVVLDESGMNIFYTITSPRSLEAISVVKMELENEQEIPPASISLGHPHDEKDPLIYVDRIDYQFQETIQFDDLSFHFNLTVLVDGKETAFAIPFEVLEQAQPSISYPIDKEVEIESQKFTIKEVLISPLRIGVKIEVDPANTKKILRFEDLRIEDENGEIWGSIQNGIAATGSGSEETIYYLQSNYFEQPKELYLQINKLAALNKEEAVLLIDTEKNVMLNAPKDGKLTLEKSNQSHAQFTMADTLEEEQNHDLVSGLVDANGKEVDISSVSMYSNDNKKHWDVAFRTTDYQNPLKLPLVDYPAYIEGDIKIKLAH